MTTDDAHAIGDHLVEDWLVSLELNAAFDRPWTDEAVAWALHGAAGDHARSVLDVGCGAGGAACAFAHHLGDGTLVVAADRDPRLVQQARDRADAEGVAHRIGLCAGEVGALPVRPGSMRVVWASGVVHHLPDQQAAVEELARLAAPGGRVVLVEGGLPLRCLPHDVGIGRPGLEARLEAARARWFEDMRTELSGPPLPYGWPEALRRAGLGDVRTRSFLAEAVPPLDEAGRRIVEQHLGAALRQLGERLDPDDRETLARLLDPDDRAGVGNRDDLVVTAVRTVHAGMRPAD
jgi:SAM-dependent methyltransferase